MNLFNRQVATLALVVALGPAMTQAQDNPCQPQVDAVDAATAAAQPLDETYAQTIEQIGALAGAFLQEAPELAGTQVDLLGQLANIQQMALLEGAGIGGDDASEVSAMAKVDADLVQLQAGQTGPDGKPRPSVVLAVNLAQQAKDQSQAATNANRDLGAAVKALTECASAAGGAYPSAWSR